LAVNSASAVDTIIGAAFEPARFINGAASHASTGLHGADGQISPRLFKIRAADSLGRRSSASILIKRRYAWRGYQAAALPVDHNANRITLTASDHDTTIGTITIGLDSAEGLHAEDVFRDEVESLRKMGHRLCEFTKLAMDPVAGSKRVLASLFHVAYIVAYRFKGYDTLLIEVNPRHVGYYTRMLGCTVLGEERLNRRVNAPAVLLHLDFSYTMARIAEFGGRPELSSGERSLYPFSFSATEEAGIMNRLKNSTWSASA